MTRHLTILLLVAACSSRPAAYSPPGGGGSGGEGSAGSGGSAPGRVCYPGDRRWCAPAGTNDAQRSVGACTDGSQLCVADGSGWQPCTGGVAPRAEDPDCDGVDQDCDGADAGCASACAVTETCGNGLDDDCDGEIDQPAACWMTCGDVDLEDPAFACCLDGTCEHLGCDMRTDQPCYSGPPGTAGKGICHGGHFSCAGGWTDLHWGTCEGEQLPGLERCGNDRDDDCDGRVDEEDGRTHRRCAPPCTASGERCNGVDDDCDGVADDGCVPGAQAQTCYAGPPGTSGVGTCRDGTQLDVGGAWSPCSSIGPFAETCGDGFDSDCDGTGGPGETEDAGCCVASGPETCNGLDDDCDGLVDEGLVNACGGCDTACHQETFPAPDCLEEWCSVVPVAGREGAFTIARTPAGRASTLVVPVVDRGEAATLDVVSGQRLWQADTYMADPRFVARPLDGSSWIGGSSVVHLDRDGNLVCKAPVGASAGLALDDLGDLWTISPAGELRSVSGTGVSLPGADGLPLCDLVQLEGGATSLALDVTPAGLAMSQRGVLWVASSPAVRIDVATLTSERIVHGDATSIALDSMGNAWFAGRELHRVLASGPWVDRALYETGAGFAADDVAASEDSVWAVRRDVLARVDPTSLRVETTQLPRRAGSVAADAWGRAWALGEAGIAWRFDPSDSAVVPFDVAPGHFTWMRGDPAGGALWSRTVARRGSTRFVYDASWPAEWLELDWYQEPADADVQVFVLAANTRDGLDTTALVCGPLSSPPVDLRGCFGELRTRFLALQFLLRAHPRERPPVVGGVTLSWTRP